MSAFTNLTYALAHIKKEPETIAYPFISVFSQLPIVILGTYTSYKLGGVISSTFASIDSAPIIITFIAIAGFFASLLVCKLIGTIFEYAVVHSVNEVENGRESRFSDNISKAVATKNAIGYSVTSFAADEVESTFASVLTGPLRRVPIWGDLIAGIITGIVDYSYKGAIFLSLPMSCIESISPLDAFRKGYNLMRRGGKFIEFSASTLFIDIFSLLVIILIGVVEFFVISPKIDMSDWMMAIASGLENPLFLVILIGTAFVTWIVGDSLKCIARTKAYLDIRRAGVSDSNLSVNVNI